MSDTARQPAADSWIDRIELIVAVILQIGILLVTAGAFVNGQWLGAFSGVVVLLLTFAPALIERQLREPLPVEFTLITCVFLFASYALGEARDFYDRFWWWDLALHGLSALIIGLIGFLSIYVFYMTHRVRVAPMYVSIITFSLAVSVGTLWEIFEFLMDRYAGLDMQKSGLIDTMTDLIINSVGALAAAAIGFFYVRDEDSLLGRRLIRNLVERNRRRASPEGRA